MADTSAVSPAPLTAPLGPMADTSAVPRLPAAPSAPWLIQVKFKELLADEPGVHVPAVVPELSTASILTTHFAQGTPIDAAVELAPETRNAIGRRLLKLTLRELFEFRHMQTDPNWSNFLYDATSDTISLLDFGAAREYPKEFIDEYIRLVWAAAEQDEDELIEVSVRLGMLTGDESRKMMRAHITAGFAIGEPFMHAGEFDFAEAKLTKQVRKQSDVFAKERLVAPPTEVYSLHRRLAGAYSTCIKLGATFVCRDLLENVYHSYAFDDK
ncbi:hypothetical protein CYMTET_46573 [Cymbomonas tetramitiformis]|uniref:ABC1 atypical kinase-like domain-containing protein n=1 Tax=Cymbomonas tetramitiformis TaxID=36881 RepID=A0AAE0BXW6_9CHLO|nr:hypothetical protein CYMTET_46573 [Cymbomonas tetramitiformis]